MNAGASFSASSSSYSYSSSSSRFYVVNGEKKWITNGMFADYFTVAVRTGGKGMGGISLLLLEKGMPGIECKQMDCMGVWASGTAYITFEDVKATPAPSPSQCSLQCPPLLLLPRFCSSSTLATSSLPPQQSGVDASIHDQSKASGEFCPVSP